MSDHQYQDRFVYLLRHGETEGGAIFRGSTDSKLNKNGISQMEKAIADTPQWDQIISSPSQRCAHFATNIARPNNTPVQININLRELDFGDWEGKSVKSIWEAEPEKITQFWKNPFRFTAPHGESTQQLQHRVQSAWKDILSKDHCRNTLIITHGGPIRIIMGQLLSIPDNKLSNIEVTPASLTKIRIPQTTGTASLCFHH